MLTSVSFIYIIIYLRHILKCYFNEYSQIGHDVYTLRHTADEQSCYITLFAICWDTNIIITWSHLCRGGSQKVSLYNVYIKKAILDKILWYMPGFLIGCPLLDEIALETVLPLKYALGTHRHYCKLPMKLYIGVTVVYISMPVSSMKNE